MPQKREKPLTVGELFELAGCPLTSPEPTNANKKHKRRKEKPIVMKLAPGHENYRADPEVTLDIVMDAIERRAEAIYKAAKGNLTIKTGKGPKKLTIGEIYMVLLCDFERKLKERLETT